MNLFCKRPVGADFKVWKLALWLVASFLLAGCQAFVTPIPQPPTLQLPSASTADPDLLGTLEPAGELAEPQTATPVPDLILSSQRYTSPQNIFTLSPPAGWTVENSEDTIRFSDPDGNSWISLQVINTGYAYDQDAFTELVSAREANTFAGFLEYSELERTIQAADGTAWVTKTVLLDDKEKRVLSFYRQDGSTVLTMDCWTDAGSFAAYLGGIEDIIDSVQFDGQAAAAATTLSTKLFQDEQYALAFEAPVYWTYKHLAGDNTSSDTFLAPDQHAAVQSLVYEDVEEVDKLTAGEFTLVLLREYYNKDIVVTKDSILADGSERLDWYSPAGDYHGSTVFRIRGNLIWLATVLVEDAYQATYQDLLERILASAAFD